MDTQMEIESEHAGMAGDISIGRADGRWFVHVIDKRGEQEVILQDLPNEAYATAVASLLTAHVLSLVAMTDTLTEETAHFRSTELINIQRAISELTGGYRVDQLINAAEFLA